LGRIRDLIVNLSFPMFSTTLKEKCICPFYRKFAQNRIYSKKSRNRR
jgi:hypothetical protein